LARVWRSLGNSAGDSSQDLDEVIVGPAGVGHVICAELRGKPDG